MNATFRFAVKACLLAAVSGALFNQAVGLLAQDGDATSASGTATPKIRQTAGVQGATATAPQTGPSQGAGAGASEVQKQLQELYRKNGREMPSMNIDDLPNTQAPVPSSTAPVQVAPNGPVVAPSPAAVKPGKPNWFERTFHVGRGKKQPPAVAQPGRPAAPGMQPRAMQQPQQQPQPRYATMQPAPHPAAPAYRAPIVTATPVPQTPAQPSLREPAPIGEPGSVTDLAARGLRDTGPATPAARPGQRNGISPPLLDESASPEDSESLDLNQDEQPKFVNQAPQILPNQNQTANRRTESPYTGLTISPNEMEQKIGSMTKPVPESKVGRAKESSVDAEPSMGSLAGTPAASEPAPLSSGDDAARRIERAAPLTAQAAKPKADAEMTDDEDDDDDDDDKPLTLPVDDSNKAAKNTAETGKSTEPANDRPAREGSEKPASEKGAEKPAPIKGFRGFCPVILKDERKLVEARAHIRSEYHGKIYTFSSVEAKETFEENPRKYIPAGDGNDVVRHATGESGVEGTLEHAAWYRGRLYLFSSADSRREFVETPSKFVVND